MMKVPIDMKRKFKLFKMILSSWRMAVLLAEIYDWTKYKNTPWAKETKKTLDYILK